MAPVNAADLDWTTTERGETEFRRKQLSDAVESNLLGCSMYELPPGKRSWPYHYHAGNEEALFILEGSGILRHDDTEYPVTAGDYAGFVADESGAHRVINDSEAPLRYLLISTMRDPDVTVYPDSEKFGVYTGSPPGRQEGRDVHGYYNLDDNVDYWEGE